MRRGSLPSTAMQELSLYKLAGQVICATSLGREIDLDDAESRGWPSTTSKGTSSKIAAYVRFSVIIA